jgi:ACS family hexuronate transporter-like MFS transporter
MPLTRLRWLILLLLFLSTAINYVDRQALSVLLPTLRSELGLTSADYGMITTLFLVAYTLSQLGSGLLVDRIGPRRGLAWSITLWSTAAIAHALARGAASVAAFRFLLGLGEAGNWPAGGKVIAQWFPPQRRAFVMGIFDSGSAVGAIIAPPLVALLALHHGWQAAFVMTGLGGFAWLAAWRWIYDEPALHRWLTPADRTRVRAETQAAAVAPPLSLGAALRSMLGRRQMWGLMVTRMLATPVWWFYVFWLPDYLAQDRGFTLSEIGFFAWIPYLTVDVGKVVGGAASDRLLRNGASISRARKSVMVAGAMAMAAGTLVVDAHTAATAIAWVCVATFGFGMWSANILALHADIFPAEKMGSALGLTGMAASLGGAVSTFAIGRLVDRAGYSPVFFVAGLAALTACLALFFWIGPVRDRN